jgi:hypothetical protein
MGIVLVRLVDVDFEIQPGKQPAIWLHPMPIASRVN